MPDRATFGQDIVVMGASAGGVDALSKLVSHLPEGLPAAVFVVLHVPAMRSSALPEILGRSGALPAAHAADGEPIEHGRIYVAPPGVHMKLRPGRIELSSSAKENSHRPAIDPLFRSAAHFYAERVVAVILSGALDDGTAGMTAVGRCGGTTIAQDPKEALFPGMPTSAIVGDHIDHVLPLNEIANLVARLASTELPTHHPEPSTEAAERLIIDSVDAQATDKPGEPGAWPSSYTCPECHGTLFEISEGEFHFRCGVGHAYAWESLLSEQSGAVEAALWTALRTLEESVSLSRRLADSARRAGRMHSAVQFSEHLSELDHHMQVMRRLLRHGDVLKGAVRQDDDAPSVEDATSNAAFQ